MWILGQNMLLNLIMVNVRSISGPIATYPYYGKYQVKHLYVSGDGHYYGECQVKT